MDSEIGTTRRGWQRLADGSAAALMLVGLAGCAWVTPARVDHVEATRLAEGASGREVEGVELPLSGYYAATIYTPVIGPLVVRMDGEPTEEGFKANTPPDVAWSLVGGVEGTLGPIFAPFLFPRGMLLTWTSGLPKDGKAGPGSIGVGTMSSMRVRTAIDDSGRVRVLWRDGRTAAVVRLARSSSDRPTTTDYLAVARALVEETRTRIYDPALVAQSAFETYASDAAESSAKARDDAEFLFGLALAARKSVRTFSPVAYPAFDAKAAGAAFAGIEDAIRPARVNFDESTGLSFIRFDAMWDAGSIDAAFEEALAKNPKGLVIDLRTAFGVSAEALRAAAWVIDGPREVGVVLDRRGREPANREGFDPKDPAIPALLTSGEHTSEAMASAIGESGLLRVVVSPGPRRVDVPVAVMVGPRTGSTSEMLAWVLKNLDSEDVRIFGGVTQGRPLVSTEFELPEGWRGRVMAMEYIPADGRRLTEGKGIEPHVKAGRDEVGKRAGEWIAGRIMELEQAR